MKNLKEIKNEISENEKIMSEKETSDRKYKSLSNKNKKLKMILMYLETDPSEDFLIAEKKRLTRIISEKNKGYNYWSSNICQKDIEAKKRRSMFNRELKITYLKNQLNTIAYIFK